MPSAFDPIHLPVNKLSTLRRHFTFFSYRLNPDFTSRDVPSTYLCLMKSNQQYLTLKPNV